jgi:alpha-beta hydrolase superfamily lysophospholipase
VSATDRLYLLEQMPTLIVWGTHDRTIPPALGLLAAGGVPGVRSQMLAGAAHFPHLEDPQGLAEILLRFLASTEPAKIDGSSWAMLLARGAGGGRQPLGGSDR